MQRRFYLAEVPNETTVIGYIARKTNMHEKIAHLRPRRRYSQMLTIRGIEVDTERMARCLSEIHETFGLFPWSSVEGPIHGYRGFSLAYNPDHQDKLEIHQSSIGTPKNNKTQYFYAETESHRYLKNSYFDCYSFRKPTPASCYGYLGELMSQFRRSRVKSRVATLYAQYFFEQTGRFNFGWHRDELIFENLRMNIPITTAPEFRFQYYPRTIDKPYPGMEGLVDKHLEVGRVYSWDTNKPHRVYCTEHTQNQRTHIVLGFSPWFDYLPEEEAWEVNEFFGELHPFDMIHEGYIHPNAYIEGV